MDLARLSILILQGAAALFLLLALIGKVRTKRTSEDLRKSRRLRSPHETLVVLVSALLGISFFVARNSDSTQASASASGPRVEVTPSSVSISNSRRSS
jgi:hypothetical protein